MLLVVVVILAVLAMNKVLAAVRLPALMLVAPNPKRLPTAAAKLTAPEPDDIVKPLTDDVALLTVPLNLMSLFAEAVDKVVVV